MKYSHNLFVAAAILTGLLFFYVYPGQTEVDPADSATAQTDEKRDGYRLDLSEEERVWVDDLLNEVDLSNELSEALYRPQIIKSHNGRLVIGDYGDMTIKLFEQDGEYIGSIGEGMGEGPGEFTQFTDFYIEDETVYVLDLRTFLVKRFSLDGTYLDQSFSVEFHPIRVSGLNGDLVILGMGEEKLFQVFDKDEGRQLDRFGTFMEDQMQNTLSVQGSILSTDDTSELVFVPRFASYVFFLNAEGSYERIYRTHDGLDFTDSREGAANEARTMMTPDRELSVADISLDSNYLYLLYQNNEEGVDNFVDVYDIVEDEYLYSFALPFPAVRFEVMSGKMYLVEPEEALLSKFHIVNGEGEN